MRFAVIALAGALGLTGGAQAADLMLDAPMEVVASSSAYDWTGFYAGVVAGYASGNINFAPVGGTPAPFDLGVSGGLLGGTVGANAQWDMFVLGAEGDLAWANISGGPTGVAPGSPATVSGSINWIGTARVRAGVAVDQALLFVTAGLAAGGVSSTANLVSTTFASTQVGWTAGAGVELAVTEDISVKAEYAYTDLGTVSDGQVLNSGNPPAINIHPTFHTVKVGANFHF